MTDLAQQPAEYIGWRRDLERAITRLVSHFGPEDARDIVLAYLETVEIEHKLHERRVETA